MVKVVNSTKPHRQWQHDLVSKTTKITCGNGRGPKEPFSSGTVEKKTRLQGIYKVKIKFMEKGREIFYKAINQKTANPEMCFEMPLGDDKQS